MRSLVPRRSGNYRVSGNEANLCAAEPLIVCHSVHVDINQDVYIVCVCVCVGGGGGGGGEGLREIKVISVDWLYQHCTTHNVKF